MDDSDYESVSRFKWTAVKCSKDRTFYAHRHQKINGEWKHVKMHRFIMGVDDHRKIDHVNGNGLDNRRANLRICTHAQNLMNMRIHNKHGFKGIAFIPGRKTRKWTGEIRPNKKRIRLGYFDTAEEAAKAYNQKAIELFGEFARLNPI